LAVITAVVAYYIQKPVNWDGPAQARRPRSFFPLHLLAVTLFATGLGSLAPRRESSWLQCIRPGGDAGLNIGIFTEHACGGLARLEKVSLSLS
jgi:hypothetical protein